MSIKVGDLVILIKACGCKSKNGVTGYIGQVSAVTPPVERPCQNCGRIWLSSVIFPCGEYGKAYVPTSWVKRIPPLEELEKEQERKDIHEPA